MKGKLLYILIYICLYITLCVNDVYSKGTFWQITDIHWDLNYNDYGNVYDMCHSHNSKGESIGTFGNFRCDSPWALVSSAISAMVQIDASPDFILWTGDNIPHVDPNPNFDVIFETISNLTLEMKAALDAPLLPVLGNHDTFPKDIYPSERREFYEAYLTKGMWKTVLPEEAQETFVVGGYYEYPISDELKVLVLNTNLYYTEDDLSKNETDPCQQFEWLRDRLTEAHSKKFKVIITGHVPPGFFERFPVIPFFSKRFNEHYLDLVTEFHDVIVVQIYGHEHTDSFRIIRDSEGKPASVALMAPSVTPWRALGFPFSTSINPSIRLYEYNSSLILDYIQFHLNLTEANLGGSPSWEKYYSLSEFFNVSFIGPDTMNNVYQQMQSDDDLFQKYYRVNSAGYNSGYCNDTCKLYQLCAIGNTRIPDLIRCKYTKTENAYIVLTILTLVAVFLIFFGAAVVIVIYIKRMRLSKLIQTGYSHI